MTGERTTHLPVHLSSSPLGHVQVNEDRVAGTDHRIDALPRRPVRDGVRSVDAGLAAHIEARGDRLTANYAEFKDLATPVRQWLALTSVKDVAATTPAERPDLRVLHHPVPDATRQDRDDVVVPERPALLIDADHLAAERLPHLLETVGAAYGSPVICRAYADWTKPGLASWFALVRHHGIQPIHNFDTQDHSRSLVALTLDALDIVDRYAVTSLVLVGDLGNALPLVTRLKAVGVKVAVIGPASNPDDIRRDADDFLDLTSLSDPARAPARGRHQA